MGLKGEGMRLREGRHIAPGCPPPHPQRPALHALPEGAGCPQHGSVRGFVPTLHSSPGDIEATETGVGPLSPQNLQLTPRSGLQVWCRGTLRQRVQTCALPYTLSWFLLL